MGARLGKNAPGEELSIDDVRQRVKLRQHDVAALRVVPHSTYAALSAHVYSDLQKYVACPDGWEVYRECSMWHLNEEGYFAVAYVNRSLRQCIIAQRGTTGALTMRAGLWVYFEETTIQFYLAKQFSKLVRLAISLEPDATEWVVSYTGHSLGGVLAACRAVEEGTFAITFEALGSRVFIKRADNKDPSTADANIVNYLRPPNIINTLKPQCGYLVMLPSAVEDSALAAALKAMPSRDQMQKQSPTAIDELDAETGNDSSDAQGQAEAAEETASSGGPLADNRLASSQTSSPGMTSPAAAISTDDSRGTSPTVTATGAVARAPSRMGAGFFRLPSLNIPSYVRGYVGGGMAFGVPELQQYVSKVEPMIRESLERTRQLHSILSIYQYFCTSKEASRHQQKMCIVRWPSHLMQYLEYINTTRALEDPVHHAVHVNTAYTEMLRRLFSVQPLPRFSIPLSYVSNRARKTVELWWTWDAERRKALGLSMQEHKALNCITIDGDKLRSTVLDIFQAKQFLSVLTVREPMRHVLEQLDHTYGAAAYESKL